MKTPPLVIKLGGSLHEKVADLVPVFQQSGRPLLIIPGGGRFADAVRSANLSDDEAHWRAIAAMNDYGRYVGSFGLSVTERLEKPQRTTIFLPFRCVKHYDPLPHSWDITSDTIAAWIAGRLGIELLILKSVDGIWTTESWLEFVTTPVETDTVDPCCIPYILSHDIKTTIINGTIPSRVAGFLQGNAVPCTRIGTTF